jgi:hypothetical protein
MQVVTGSAFYRFEDGGARSAFCISGQDIVCAAAGRDVYAAALSDESIIVVGPEGEQQIGGRLPHPARCMLMLNEEPLRVLVGTQGAHLFELRQKDSGYELAKIDSFEGVEGRESWYTPWGGPPSVRSLAGSADGRLYADIHVGGIVRSADGGETWEPVNRDIHEDVHQIAVTPADPDALYANTAKGVFVSPDHGKTWHHRADDLDQRYGRAIAVHPDNPDLLLASVSDGPRGRDVNGQLYRSEDRGRSWAHVTQGFPPSTSGNIDTYHVAFAKDGQAYAAVESALFRSRDDGRTWSRIWTAPDPIKQLLPKP